MNSVAFLYRSRSSTIQSSNVPLRVTLVSKPLRTSTMQLSDRQMWQHNQYVTSPSSLFQHHEHVRSSALSLRYNWPCKWWSFEIFRKAAIRMICRTDFACEKSLMSSLRSDDLSHLERAMLRRPTEVPTRLCHVSLPSTLFFHSKNDLPESVQCSKCSSLLKRETIARLDQVLRLCRLHIVTTAMFGRKGRTRRGIWYQRAVFIFKDQLRKMTKYFCWITKQ